jgi:hypothetical protein
VKNGTRHDPGRQARPSTDTVIQHLGFSSEGVQVETEVDMAQKRTLVRCWRGWGGVPRLSPAVPVASISNPARGAGYLVV